MKWDGEFRESQVLRACFKMEMWETKCLRKWHDLCDFFLGGGNLGFSNLKIYQVKQENSMGVLQACCTHNWNIHRNFWYLDLGEIWKAAIDILKWTFRFGVTILGYGIPMDPALPSKGSMTGAWWRQGDVPSTFSDSGHGSVWNHIPSGYD